MITTGAPRNTALSSRRQPASPPATANAAARATAAPRCFDSASIRAMPTPREIYLRRLETVRERLRSVPADGLFATPSSNLFYLTGIDFHRSERLTALFLFRDRDPVVVCPAFEAARLKGMSAVGEVVTWEETGDAWSTAAKLFPASAGTLAVEPSTAYDDVERLLSARPGWKPVSAAGLFGALRMIKTPDEIQLMRKAIEVALPRFRRAFESLRPGATEAEISHAFGGENVVQFGPSSAFPHGASGPDRALEEPGRPDRRLGQARRLLLRHHALDLTSGVPPTSTARSGRSSSRPRARRSKRRRRACPASRSMRRPGG